MSKVLVFALLAQQLLAAVFFFGRGGLEIFPAVTNGPHATTEASGKISDSRARPAAQIGCRLQKRGRGKGRVRRVRPMTPKATSSVKKPNQRHTRKRDQDRSSPTSKSPDPFPRDYAIYNARRIQPLKDEDGLSYRFDNRPAPSTLSSSTDQPTQLLTC
ncbi:hypothetical protein DSO57_1025361 [Entomophthora muscae]|uniref:Uncharacterized protein n=1 Tax=Entomophthora muscae TaxID=34485 RepID=A0ACC2TDG3_9FUNG|nr:hypothetical protein DSO57_1025361 [Entomophthora muscae]